VSDGIEPLGVRPNSELLGEFVALMNAHGPDSWQTRAFLRDHLGNDELVALCQTTYWLKKALAGGWQ
jgi:hypothetical protein